MITVNDILKNALALGLLEKPDKTTDWKRLAGLLFSPQCIDFCEKHNFPGIEQLRAVNDEEAPQHNIFIDKGIVKVDNEDIILVGDTRGEMVFDDASRLYRVIVMHGADAFIVARNYAHVRVYNIGNNKVDIHRDKSAVILR